MADYKRVFERDDAQPQVLYAKRNASDNDAYPILVNSSGQLLVSGGMNLPEYDFVSLTISPDTTETYTFKTGGSGGTTVSTVVIVYTDATRSTISTVTKT